MIDTEECSGDLRATIDAAIGGNRDAFGVLYGRYEPAVRGYIGRRIGDRATVEDFVQEVFRKAFLAMPRYQHRGIGFSAFVITIARNLIVDYFKSAYHRTFVAASQAQLVETVDGDRWVDPEYRAVHGDAVAVLTEALGRLTVDQRMCLELRFFRGLSIPETAAAMGKNEGAIKALQQRATSTLARDPAMEALR